MSIFRPGKENSQIPDDFSATTYFKGRSSISGYLPTETYRTQPAMMASLNIVNMFNFLK